MLYLVATPIGNLKDITLRALETLYGVNTILCEDTRKTASLLRHFQKPGQAMPELISFYEENELSRMPEVTVRLKVGQDLALVTNAGTPTISDPGFKLVRECWKEGIKVIAIPGPCSPIAALTSSGLPTDKFTFLGFLQNKSSARIKLLEKVKESVQILPSTVIFFESPFRLIKSLNDLQQVFGDIEIVIVRELTKVFEEIKRAKVSQLKELYLKQTPKGEFIIVFRL